MTGAKEVATPMCSTSVLVSGGTQSVDAKLYRQAIGRLQYLGFTRPDIAFAVNKLAQHIQ